MTAEPARLPRDLQDRLDAILAKPVLRRCPKLQQAIGILVRNAYERPAPSLLSGSQRALLAQLELTRGGELTAFPLPALDEIRKLAAGKQEGDAQ